MIDGQQGAQAPVANPKYDDPQFELAQNENYPRDNSQLDDGPALVKEDQSSDSSNSINDNAKLIDKIQSLQQDIQELRGQLEVQAHDLKLLQQQQVAFYKDLDARIGGGTTKTAQSKPATDISLGSNTAPAPSHAPVPTSKQVKTAPSATPPAIAVSRANPADEQIGYLAAYELVKQRRFDDAINAMQIFTQKYPKGGYTANAQYWLGELYLAKNNYPKAIEHFEIVLTQFPSSTKTAASMLKVGYAYAEKGDKAEAKKRLQQVVSTYPNTQTAKLAHVKLAKIN